MTINRYYPFAFIYFFINVLALPLGLTYMALLSPLLYWWTVTTRKKEILLGFLVILTPFLIAHLLLQVDEQAYLVSVLNYIMVYIFCQAFYTFLVKVNNPDRIFRHLLIANFLLCLIAIPIYFTPFRDVLWMTQNISDNVENVNRLKLFTYEASYYAVMFTPLFFFFFMQVILKQNKMNSWFILLMITLPYLLSFSLGAMSCIAIALGLSYLFHFKKLTRKKRWLTILSLTLIALLAAATILWIFFPGNGLFTRLGNIVSGHDTSGNGRTTDAFYLAMQMLDLKSPAWGIGAGQIKILGADIVRSYYLYDLDYNNIAIPNAVAETLAIFGWIGLVVRLGLQIFLFFFTRVWTNYFRLMLFLFIFLYQFTGSFITNIAEYVIWILAFTNCFPQFNTRPAPFALDKNTNICV